MADTPGKTAAAAKGPAQDATRQDSASPKDSTEDQDDSLNRRTEMSADRTVFAAERTYAAWMRTGLTALASGIGARALLANVVERWIGQATGSVLILFSSFCFIAAIWRQMSQVDAPSPDARRLPSALLIAVNGFLVLVSLAAVVGLWTA